MVQCAQLRVQTTTSGELLQVVGGMISGGTTPAFLVATYIFWNESLDRHTETLNETELPRWKPIEGVGRLAGTTPKPARNKRSFGKASNKPAS